MSAQYINISDLTIVVVRNLEDWLQVLATDRVVSIQLAPELEAYLRAHPPSSDTLLDPESRSALQELRNMFDEARNAVLQDQALRRTEPLTIIHGDEPGVFTTNWMLGNVNELKDAFRLYEILIPQDKGYQFTLRLKPEFEAELMNDPEVASILEEIRQG
ncbi:hypothetical protein HYFRA_00010632 [Hymenoscyphus fraxineus]|uniref:Uncharacterized protein n=1 Tax=Hymenoscyphus fraxineus TaxID=746836 RepID=A0A9N9L8S4_9HELO|nr:hypothetical protein HYFRA_00010632 [Hymenoscyphus fraxineus]